VLSAVALAAVAMIGLLDWLRGRVMRHAARLFDARMTGIAASVQLDGNCAHHGPAALPPVRALEIARNGIAAQHVIPAMDVPWTPLFVAALALIHPLIAMIVIVGLLVVLIPNFFQKAAPAPGASDVSLSIQEHEWTNADVVRSLGMDRAMVARYERHKFLAGKRRELTGGEGSALASVSRALRIALQITVLAVGAVLAVEKQISPGALIAASILSSRALAPVEQLAQSWRPVTAALRALKSLKLAALHLEQREQPTRLPHVKGHLEFEGVAVVAPGQTRPLFQQARFLLAPGEIVGVVGNSGAGKSSLARAAIGALSAVEGVVRIDGIDIRRWDPEWLGRHVGYVPQEVGLFSGTIADNISRFEEMDPDERSRLVVEAATAAGASNLISRLPDGYDTVLSLNGRGLSHGQSQRIALARALYRSPALLVLDEPNSHLDDEGEAALISALQAARARGAACLIVAHRMGVMRIADRILAVRDGRIDGVPKEHLFARRVVLSGQKASA
jgi:ATP-binding cassette subfamily C protein